MSSIDVINFLQWVIFSDNFIIALILLSPIPVTIWLIHFIEWASKSKFGRWLDAHVS